MNNRAIKKNAICAALPVLMSALGQKQTYAAQKVMSALPPKADMCGAAGMTALSVEQRCGVQAAGIFAQLSL